MDFKWTMRVAATLMTACMSRWVFPALPSPSAWASGVRIAVAGKMDRTAKFAGQGLPRVSTRSSGVIPTMKMFKILLLLSVARSMAAGESQPLRGRDVQDSVPMMERISERHDTYDTNNTKGFSRTVIATTTVPAVREGTGLDRPVAEAPNAKIGHGRHKQWRGSRRHHGVRGGGLHSGGDHLSTS